MINKTAQFSDISGPDETGPSTPVQQKFEPKQDNSLSEIESPKDINKKQNVLKQQSVINSGFATIKKMQNDLNNLSSAVKATNNAIIWGLINSKSGTPLTSSDHLSVSSVDGKWGKNTQEALQTAYKLIVGLINTNNSFNLNVPGYTPEYLSNFRQLISGFKLDKNGHVDLPLLGDYNQVWRAKLLSVHLNAIIIFYNDIVNALKNDERINTSNKTLVKKDGPKINEEEDKIIKDYLNQFGEHDLPLTLNLDGKQVKITIPVIALQSVKDFQDWFSTNKYNKEIKPYGSSENFFNQVVKPQLG